MLTESMTGKQSDDPLKYAFDKKKSAHAGLDGQVIDPINHQLAWQKVLSSRSRISQPRVIYIHIPFCRTKCSYCRFFQNVSKESLITDYVNALVQEIKNSADSPFANQASFDAVYFGGGTPTDLTAGQIYELVSTIKEHYRLSTNVEITLEGRINDFDDHKVNAAIAAGVNRISLGVQSFNTKVRQALKRMDEGDYVLERIQQLTARNELVVALDLMFGLPFQTLDIWQEDLEKFIVSGAHGVDLYQLIDMKGTGLEAGVKSGKLPAPASTQMKAEMYRQGHDFMVNHHVPAISTSHWATSRTERSLYNSLVKSGATILPFGSGGGGNMAGYNMMLHRSLKPYFNMVESGQKPIMHMAQLNHHFELEGWIKSGFDSGVLRFHQQPESCELQKEAKDLFNAWQDNGLIQWDEDYLVLTLAGRFWSVRLSQALLTYLFKKNDALN